MKDTHGYTLIVKNCRGTLFSSVDTRMEARRHKYEKKEKKGKRQKTHGNFYTWHRSFFFLLTFLSFFLFFLFLYKIVSFVFSATSRNDLHEQSLYKRITKLGGSFRDLCTYTHIHIIHTHARIYAQTHAPTLFKNCAEK